MMTQTNNQTNNQAQKNSRNKKNKKLIKWAIIGVITVVLLAFAYTKLNPTEEVPNFITAEVSRGDVERTVMASGKVKAINTVQVGAQTSGEVTKLYVKIGDVVKKGDLIAQVDEISQQNQLSNTQATLTQTLADLQTANANLYSQQTNLKTTQSALLSRQSEVKKANITVQQAKTDLSRLALLLKVDAISQQEYDKATTTLQMAQVSLSQSQENSQQARLAIESSKASIAQAQANIASKKASIQKSQTNVNTAQEDLGYTTIRAPMAGTVVSVTTEEGSTVNANQSTPTIVTLADLSRVRINAQISEADIIKVQTGMPVEYNMIGTPDNKLTTKLMGIEPAPENISTTSSTNSAIYYIGYIEVPNTDGRLRIDMTAQLTIIIDQATDVLTVPSSAIKEDDKGKVVKILDENNEAQPQSVEVGLDNRVNAEILNGLNEGDKIIIGEGAYDDTKKGKKPRGM